MKTKGITFWEQHVEHIALGVAGLLFIGLAAMQFLGNPNAVEANGRTVGPGEVDGLLRDQARKISEKISPTESGPTIEPPKAVSETFKSKLASAISPKPTLWVSSPRISPAPSNAVDPAGGAFVQADIAAPSDVKTQQYVDTIQPEVVAGISELQELLPSAPHDIIWTTVSAMFDVADVVKQWSTDKDGGRALPPSWTESRAFMVDVIAEREELMEDGQFSNLVTINTLPARLTFRPQLSGPVDGAVRDEVLGTLDDPASANEIIQPEFYPTLADAWAPPGAVQTVNTEANADNSELVKLKSALKRLTLERDRLLAKMKENGCSEEQPVKEDDSKKKPKTDGGGSSGGGGMAPPGAGGGPSGASSGGRGFREPPGEKQNESKCKEMRNKLKNLKVRIEKLEQGIARLEPKDAAAPEKEEKKEDKPLDVMQIWAHDISVQPGKTYRYRMTVKIYNPLFGRKLDLIPEQQPLAEQFTVSSKTSEWSESITVEPPLRVFVIDANPRANLAAIGAAPFGSASAEVYRFFGGRWWSQDINVRPGDRIGNADKPTRRGEGNSPAIDFGSNWFLLDVVESAEAGALVLLQSLDSSMETQYRDPKADANNPDRSWLRDAVAEANLNAPLASK